MPAVTRNEREAIARARLIRVLRRHGIATWRTLEQKIADAGPPHMRINPHILTPVRKALEEAGSIKRRSVGGGIWFSAHDTPSATVKARLAQQLPVYKALQVDYFKKRMGQAYEIAISRALSGQTTLTDQMGHFLDLDDHDDGTLYSKEEPPRRIGLRDIVGDRRLDFMVRHPVAGWVGIEAKNVRQWLYPDRPEIFDLLSKCYALDVVPVLIARRIHFSTFALLSACGVITHETFNQLFPTADTALADLAKHKDNLGYHDIRIGNAPNARLTKFIGEHLPAVLPQARERFDEFKDLIGAYVRHEMDYPEFAARVRRRRLGQNEDSDGPEFDPDDHA